MSMISNLTVQADKSMYKIVVWDIKFGDIRSKSNSVVKERSEPQYEEPNLQYESESDDDLIY